MTHGKTPLLPSLSEATYVKRAYARCIFESQGNSQLQSDKYNSRQLPTAIPTGNISLSLARSLALRRFLSVHPLPVSRDKSCLFQKTFEQRKVLERMKIRSDSIVGPLFKTRGARGFTIVLEAEKLVYTLYNLRLDVTPMPLERARLRAMKQGYHCVLVNDSCVATV